LPLGETAGPRSERPTRPWVVRGAAANCRASRGGAWSCGRSRAATVTASPPIPQASRTFRYTAMLGAILARFRIRSCLFLPRLSRQSPHVDRRGTEHADDFRRRHRDQEPAAAAVVVHVVDLEEDAELRPILVCRHGPRSDRDARRTQRNGGKGNGPDLPAFLIGEGLSALLEHRRTFFARLGPDRVLRASARQVQTEQRRTRWV